MGKRIKTLLLKARDAWLVLCVALLYLLVLEVAVSIGYAVKDGVRASSAAARDERARAEIYAGVSWSDEYFKELEESDATRWASYVYWRRLPYEGRHINVDARGLRRTWADGKQDAETRGPLKIFMFGGSAMWGVGARDDFTIASWLARKLHERGIRCRVTNFGESGYVSTQEVVALLQELRDGNIPDLVVFYDGVNDIYSAYQQRVAGLPQNEFNRVQEFNVSQPRSYSTLRRLWLRRAIGELSTVRLARNLLRRVGIEVDPAAAATYDVVAEDSAADQEALSREVLAVYEGNVRAVNALGESYGFKALFYWQPTVFAKGPLTAFEEKVQQGIAGLQPYCEQVSQVMRQGSLTTEHGGIFRDLSEIFSQTQRPVFMDWCHISEWGNQLVADQMAGDAARILMAAYAVDRSVGQ